jgi:quinohemoprotein amine dehydrogenase
MKPMLRAFGVVFLSLVFAMIVRVAANGQASSVPQAVPTTQGQTPQPAARDTDEGIPITNDLTIQVCGECHKVDGKSRMSRISYRRTTPEGWQETIRRMVTLNKAQIDPADARVIVKYLSDNLGLAPEEAMPGAFESERRFIDHTYTANADTAGICSSCHSMGRVILQRRTGEDWDGLVAMHRGWYPLVDNQVFRRFGPPSTTPGPDGRPPDNRHPMDKALAHLKSAFPLKTPEWSAWSATMRRPRIEGTWALTGYEVSEGPIAGRVVIAAGASPDEFTTTTTFTYTKTGRAVSRAGRTMIYTGFQWRGRSTVGSDDNTSLREVMFVDRGWQSITGRWFTGSYDELGIDVTLTRVGRDPVISGFDRKGVKRGTNDQTIRVFGQNLPSAVTAADVDLGPGVTVTRASLASPNEMSLVLNVSAEAPIGPRDLSLAGQVTRSALAVYDKIDYMKVTPGWGLGRVGGVMYPKMIVRFEAIAWSHGADGKPDTKDDIDLGAVDATWSLEEYTATFDDDDIRFVGEIDRSRGVFTPAVDGPNPKRSGNRNNVGDVWVVAAHTPAGGEPLRSRAHLVVTVPLYMRWDFFTINQR